MGRSYYVERLTHELMHGAWALIEEVESLGAWPRRLKPAFPRCVLKSCGPQTGCIDSGKDVIVGVNAFASPEEPMIPVLDIDNARCVNRNLNSLAS